MTRSLKHYFILCKPRVVALMLLTTWAGMYLATSVSLPWSLWLSTTLGVGLMAGAAATVNHIMDRHTDALMQRTRYRPLATGKLSPRIAWCFASVLGSIGFATLLLAVNTLTAILTLLAAIGYAGFYTLYLKHATPQNIVIGGLAGAMPPLLGWTAVTNQLDPQGWLLVLIIFAWTPAHFWALSLYRYDDYAEAAVPMLPVTHGVSYTKLCIILYSLLTLASSLMPYAIGMSGKLYFLSACLLNAGLILYAVKLLFSTDAQWARKTFHYSLIYLTLLFSALLLDHYLGIT